MREAEPDLSRSAMPPPATLCKRMSEMSEAELRLTGWAAARDGERILYWFPNAEPDEWIIAAE
jgi:hypothetical protein